MTHPSTRTRDQLERWLNAVDVRAERHHNATTHDPADASSTLLVGMARMHRTELDNQAARLQRLHRTYTAGHDLKQGTRAIARAMMTRQADRIEECLDRLAEIAVAARSRTDVLGSTPWQATV